MTKLTELYQKRDELTQTQATLEMCMDYFDDIKLYALAEQTEDDLDRVIQSHYVIQTQINKLEKLEKLDYTKELIPETEEDEQVLVATYDNEPYIYITVMDVEEAATVTLTLKEAQRLKRYLENAITTNIINWEGAK